MARLLRIGQLAPLAMCFALLLALAPTAHAAGSGVAIQGFAFHPPSLTVPVGSTITWTNQDSAPHTATAKDGSFDTGTLKQGQSMTITFSKAGTFAYYCQFHPFMLGTVTVTAAAAPLPITAPAAAPALPTATPAPQAQPATTQATATATVVRNAPAHAASAPLTTQVTTTQQPLPNKMPSTGAGGSASVWAGAGLVGLIILTLGSATAMRKR